MSRVKREILLEITEETSVWISHDIPVIRVAYYICCSKNYSSHKYTVQKHTQAQLHWHIDFYWVAGWKCWKQNTCAKDNPFGYHAYFWDYRDASPHKLMLNSRSPQWCPAESISLPTCLRKAVSKYSLLALLSATYLPQIPHVSLVSPISCL